MKSVWKFGMLPVGMVAVAVLVYVWSNPSIIPSSTHVLDFDGPIPITNDTNPDPIPVLRPDYSEDRIALLIHEKINQYRVENNREPLQYNDVITGVAKSHSIDMMNNNYFDHRGTDGTMPTDRGQSAGFKYCGDPAIINEYITLRDNFIIHQDQVNSEIITLNKKTQIHNDQVQTFNRQQYYQNSFSHKDQLSANIMQREYEKLTTTANELKAQTEKYNQANTILDSEHDRIAQIESNNNIGLGFSENILQGFTYTNTVNGIPIWSSEDEIAQRSVDAWLHSQGHKDNIMNYWGSEGIGLVINPNDNSILITENFC